MYIIFPAPISFSYLSWEIERDWPKVTHWVSWQSLPVPRPAFEPLHHPVYISLIIILLHRLQSLPTTIYQDSCSEEFAGKISRGHFFKKNKYMSSYKSYCDNFLKTVLSWISFSELLFLSNKAKQSIFLKYSSLLVITDHLCFWK